ncbi:hypothetical protein HDU76_013154 [Blyttiomyces sp. JEL0837]|nr:hypothetical protein HDU76_013154 [Blyttiomyces sp. JEL0837]
MEEISDNLDLVYRVPIDEATSTASSRKLPPHMLPPIDVKRTYPYDDGSVDDIDKFNAESKPITAIIKLDEPLKQIVRLINMGPNIAQSSSIIDFTRVETLLEDLKIWYPRHVFTMRFLDSNLETEYMDGLNARMSGIRRLFALLVSIFIILVTAVSYLNWPEDIRTYHHYVFTIIAVELGHLPDFYLADRSIKELTPVNIKVRYRLGLQISRALSSTSLAESSYAITSIYFEEFYKYSDFWPRVYLSTFAVYALGSLSITALERVFEETSRQTFTVLMELRNRNIFEEDGSLTWAADATMDLVDQSPTPELARNLRINPNLYNTRSRTAAQFLNRGFNGMWEEKFQSWNTRAMVINVRLFYLLEACGAIFHVFYDAFSLCSGQRPSLTYCPSDSTGPIIFKTRLGALLPLYAIGILTTFVTAPSRTSTPEQPTTSYLAKVFKFWTGTSIEDPRPPTIIIIKILISSFYSTMTSYIDAYQLNHDITNEGLSTIFRTYHLQEILSTAGLRLSMRQVFFIVVMGKGNISQEDYIDESMEAVKAKLEMIGDNSRLSIDVIEGDLGDEEGDDTLTND